MALNVAYTFHASPAHDFTICPNESMSQRINWNLTSLVWGSSNLCLHLLGSTFFPNLCQVCWSTKGEKQSSPLSHHLLSSYAPVLGE